MQVTAILNNLRMTPRKVRQLTNLVKGMDIKTAQAQLRFINKKAAGIILKLLNSGLANGKHNFNLDENNLYIKKLVVEAGPSLKRWLPRAMGRTTPILKRTCSVKMVLDEKVSDASILPAKKKVKMEKEKAVIERMPVEKVEKEEKIFAAVSDEKEFEVRPVAPPRPYGASSESKKRFFSRQTFGNIKKMFRRKSI